MPIQGKGAIIHGGAWEFYTGYQKKRKEKIVKKDCSTAWIPVKDNILEM